MSKAEWFASRYVLIAVGSVRDAVPPSGGGVLVPFGALAALARDADVLLQESDRRSEMARAGHAWVREHHNWTVVADRLDALYRDLSR